MIWNRSKTDLSFDRALFGVLGRSRSGLVLWALHTSLVLLSTPAQAQTPALATSDARLFYGDNTAPTDQIKFRVWDQSGSSWSAEAATATASDTILWSLHESTDTDTTLELSAVFSKSGAGTRLDLLRLKDGVWTQDWSTTGIDAANADKRGFDLAFEHSSGQAVIVYSNNSSSLQYRTYTESGWSAEDDVFATPPGTGTVLWVELAALPQTDDIALVYADDNGDLFATVWAGDVWSVTLLATLETNLMVNPITTEVHNRVMDVAYESLSEDLMVAWGQSGSDGFFYSTLESGTATWSSAKQILAPSGGMVYFVDLASRPESDQIAGAFVDLGGGVERLGLATWTGSAWADVGEYDSQILNGNDAATGDFPAAVDWIGCGGLAAVVYTDNQTGTLDWALWRESSGWAIQSDIAIAGKGYTESVVLRQFPRIPQLMAVISDDNNDLYAATFDGSSWTLTNGGAALETSLSSITTVPFALEVSPRSEELECLSFTNVTKAASLNTVTGIRAASWGDYDNDGFLDLFVTHSTGSSSKLFHNEGDGTFTVGPNIAPVNRSGHWGDYTNDGFLDFIGTGGGGAGATIQVNNGDGTFTLQDNDAIGFSGPTNLGDVSFIDYDEDGWLDIWAPDGGGNYMFRNLGDGTFTTPGSNEFGLSPSSNGEITTVSDYDGDGHTDILYRSSTVVIWNSDGDGTFTEVTGATGIGMAGDYRGVAFADYNNDGFLDVYGGQDGANILYLNDGDGTFTDRTVASGTGGPSLMTRGVTWGDFDNDGDLDLYVAHSDGANNLFENSGDGTFSDEAIVYGLADTGNSYGTCWADYDNDGDLDLYVANDSGESRLYMNNQNDSNYLKIKVTGRGAGFSAVDGTGSRVELWDSAGATLLAVREVSGGDGYGSHSPHLIHIGVPDAWGGAAGSYQVQVRFPSGDVVIRNGVVPQNESLLIGGTTLSQTIEVEEPGSFTKLQILLPGETAAPGTASGKTGTPDAQTAGASFNVTVNAVDPDWNVVDGATDTVSISSTDTNASLPGNSALVGGTHSFTVTLKTAGSRTLTTDDVTDSDITPSTSPPVTVGAGSFSALQILLPGETAAPGTISGKTGTPSARTAGSAFNVTLNAVDALWNRVTNITDVVAISSSDDNAVLPANTPLSSGTRVVVLTLRTVGTWTVTANDTDNGGITSDTSPPVVVNPTSFSKLQILCPGESAAPGSASGKTGTPTPQIAGSSFTITVHAVDANWNVASGITDVVRITASDTYAILPSDAALSDGTQDFSVTLKVAGFRTLTASDVTDAGKSPDTSSPLTIDPGLFAALQTLAPGETAVPGSPSGRTGAPTSGVAGSTFDLTVNAVDASWNRVTTATDLVRMTSSDLYATLPANASLVSGTQTFALILNTVGSWTVTATDLIDAAKTPGTTPPIAITTGAFTKLQLLVPGETAVPGSTSGKTGSPDNQVAGQPFGVTVRTVDNNWNLVPTSESIGWTSTDPNAVVPSSFAVSGGTAVASVTLNTVGSWSVTAHDLTDPSRDSDTSSLIPTLGGEFSGLQVLLPGETSAPGTETGKSGTPYLQTAGESFAIVVNAVDENWNLVPTVSDQFSIASSDPFAEYPATAIFAEGTRTLAMTLKTASVDETTVTAADLSDPSRNPNTSSPVTANAGELAALQVLVPGEIVREGSPTGKSGSPSDQSAGSPFTVTIRAVDACWNLISSFDGTIRIDSDDPLATLPETAPLESGEGLFSVTLASQGNWTVTAEDLSGSGLGLATSAPISIDSNLVTRLLALAPGELAAPGTESGRTGTPLPQVVGVPFPITIHAVDDGWNLVETAQDRIGIWSEDFARELSDPTTLVSGAQTVLVAFAEAGAWSVIAVDSTNTAVLDGQTGTIQVEAVATGLLVILPGESAAPGTDTGKAGTPLTQRAGEAFEIEVRAVDDQFELVPGNKDLVLLSSSDPEASLPPAAVLQAGIGTFAVTGFTTGSTDWTVQDLSNDSVPPHTGTLNVDPGPAATIVAISGGGQEGAIGTGLADPLIVSIEDAWTNPIPGLTVNFSFASEPTGAEGAELDSESMLSDASGRAQTAVLLGSKPGAYEVVASSSGLASEGRFTVTATTTASVLAFVASPGSTAGGTPFLEQPIVEIQDESGNRILLDGIEIHLEIGTPPGGETLLGTAVVSAEDGRAEFSGLAIDLAGIDYTLVARAEGLRPAISGPFDITVGEATELVWSRQPGESVAGRPFSIQPEVEVVDAGGNRVLAADLSIFLSLLDPPLEARLEGVDTRPTIEGVARFGGLRVNRPGDNYQLLASSPGLVTVPSEFFDVLEAVVGTIAIVSGNGQEGDIDTWMAESMGVRVTDAKDRPLSGVRVHWNLTTTPDDSRGAELLARAKRTDVMGLASCKLILGDLPGLYEVSATLDEPAIEPAVFSALAVLPSGTGTASITPNAVYVGIETDLSFLLRSTGGDLIQDVQLEISPDWFWSDPETDTLLDGTGFVGASVFIEGSGTGANPYRVRIEQAALTAEAPGLVTLGSVSPPDDHGNSSLLCKHGIVRESSRAAGRIPLRGSTGSGHRRWRPRR